MVIFKDGEEGGGDITVLEDYEWIPFCICSLRWEGGGGEGVRNSSVVSVLGSLSCVVQRRGFDPPLSLRQQKGFFPWS